MMPDRSQSREPPRPLCAVTDQNRDRIALLLDEYMRYMEQYQPPGAMQLEADPRETFANGEDGFEPYGIEGPTRILAGFVFLRVYPRGLYVVDMFVEPPRQRFGYGTLAIDAVKTMATERHLNAVGASVFRRNVLAQRFWARQGFIYVLISTELGYEHMFDTFTWTLRR